MKEKILIVEDRFIEANDLKLMLSKAGYQVVGIAGSVQKAKTLIEQNRPDIVLLDIFLTGTLTGIDLAVQLREEHIAFVYLSANSNEELLEAAKATQPYGFLVKPFREKDVLVTLEIARYRHEHALKAGSRQEALLRTELEQILARTPTSQHRLLEIAKALQPYFPFEYLSVGFRSDNRATYNAHGFLRIGFDEYQEVGKNELMIIARLNERELAELEAATVHEVIPSFYNEETLSGSLKTASIKRLLADTFQLKSLLVLPMPYSESESFSFSFFSRRPAAYNAEYIAFFSRIQRVLTKALESFFSKIPKQQAGRVSTRATTPEERFFEGIIGKSHLLLNVFDNILQVAPTETSVLILGESGTGKERIAESIHRISPRSGKPLVKVNCAALPPSLIESELFGHEKGAFTGALEKRIGKFELASEGTIFLDEIGEMPFEMQVKLLRVLQEKEIERIGGRAPQKVNIRIIAATNRNLEREVAEGRFRLDLYYRLNVFPILLPPLRERKEDIPLLVTHFINYFNRKTGKKVSGLSEKLAKNMTAYNWPGNIRELEHVIERSILLAKGPTIDDVALPGLPAKHTEAASEETRIKTMHENERDHIIAVLRKCNGRIWGAGAAAEVLNLPPSTLKSKMIKLGIKKEYTK